MRPGAYFFAPAGPSLSTDEVAFFKAANPFGFILFQRNCETPEQLRRLTSSLRDSVGRDAPILIDQEGGRVQRMRAPHWQEWMPPLDQVAACADPRAMYLRGLLIGAELLAHGIDVNCAPSADLAWDQTHEFLRNRCYGETVDAVVAQARACADGLMDAGCLPVLKHAPGHGRAVLDSHKALPRIDAPLSELEQTDFAPFKALADLPMVMTAHIVLPQIDADRPVTISKEGIAYLRQHIGLTGFLMTDDISMGALAQPLAEKSRLAMAAGCDAILHCNGDLDEMQVIAHEIGEIPDDRADIALGRRRPPIDIDIPALQEEFRRLIAGA